MLKRTIFCTVLMITAMALSASLAHSQSIARSNDPYSNFASRSLMPKSEFRLLASPAPMANPFATRSPTSPSLELTALAISGFPPITGNGTPGQIAYFSAGTIIRGSIITQSKAGNIGIGTTAPGSKLSVAGMIQSLSEGFKFPDGTVQTTSAMGSLFTVEHDATLTGDGTSGMPLGVAVPLFLSGEAANFEAIIRGLNTGASGIGVFGETSPFGIGVLGSSSSGTGVAGQSDDGAGVSGFGFSNVGVVGLSNTGTGVRAESISGIGVHSSTDSGEGVLGFSSSGIGVHGISFSGTGVRARSISGLAGEFDGDVDIIGTLTKGGGSFKIDHPLDPENRFLYHSFVESPDMMNVYNGNITTDQNGEAVVTLPDYFHALNRDFRYQLTVIGQFAQAIVAHEIADSRFTIKTDHPGVKVSWQVTGIRKDPWAERNRIPVVEEKKERERGFYLHPEVFDQPEERGLLYLKDPELVKRMKEAREQIKRNQQ